MEYRSIGSSGIKASVVALGAWAIGGGPWWGDSDDQEAVRAIHAALDAGANLIDTAPLYGYGHSEIVIGRALKGRRDKAVVATKGGLWWKDGRGAPFFEQGDKTVRRCVRPETLKIELDESLQRLGIDVIDLYQIHWQALPEDPTPIADTMGALMDMKAAGKIRSIGVSNCTPQQMDEYRKVGPIDANQPRYSMLDRAIEKDGVLEYCRKHNVAVLAYSPLEQGLLTGRFKADTPVGSDEFRTNLAWFKAGNREKVISMLDGWADLTRKYNCTLSQLVIAWTVAQPGLTIALCGARKVGHVDENIGAGRLTLAPDDIARMRADAEGLGEAAVD